MQNYNRTGRKILKIIIVLIIVANYILLALRWIFGELDDNYGCGFRIRSDFMSDSKKGRVALAEIYDEIASDFVYYVGFTTLLSICLIILAIINTNENSEKESNKDKELVS